jgi:hypothetical protein
MTTKLSNAARAAAALSLAVAAGCSHASTETLPPLYASQAKGRAGLYLGAAPSRPHRDLGLVQAVGFGNRSRPTDVLHSLRREGQRMGCDAVVNVDVHSDGERAQAVGVCIRWVEPSALADYRSGA